MPSLPFELQPTPKNETAFSLVFRKGQTQWLINLWSNQVTEWTAEDAPDLVFAGDRLYRFVLPAGATSRSHSFAGYKPADTQRAKAEAKYTALINHKRKEGFAIQADSRPTSARVKKQKETATKNKPPPKNATGWEALAYWGSRHHEIDRAAFSKAMALVKKRYGQTQPLPPEHVTSFNELFENTTEPWVQFATLLVAKHTVPLNPKPLKITLQKSKPPKAKFFFIPGDLEIEGDLNLGIDLFIAGSLTVNGLIRDTREWTHLLVAGDLTASKGIDVGSQFYATGSITAPCIAIDGTGQLIGKRISADVLIEEGFDHSVKGAVKAKHHLDFAHDDAETAIKTLDHVLAPKVAKAIRATWKKEGDDFYFPKELLWK